jgi:phage shock protein PspC (stress-responsive transcriptional regulator)
MTNDYKRLYRSRTDKMISGLCAGLGEYLGIDPTVIRLLFALAFIFLFPLAEIAYLIMMVIVPEEPQALPRIEETPQI